MFSSIRVDCISSYHLSADEMSKFIKLMDSKISFYYIQLEESDVVGKLHWQGWAYHTFTDNYWRTKCAKYFKSLSSDFTKNNYSFSKIKNFDDYYRYICLNDSKSNPTYTVLDYTGLGAMISKGILYMTNYSDTELTDISSKLDPWLSKKKLNKKKMKGETFYEAYVNAYKDGLATLCESVAGSLEVDSISNDPIPHVIKFTVRYFEQNSKVHDEIILYRMINGLLSQCWPGYYRKSMDEKLRLKFYI